MKKTKILRLVILCIAVALLAAGAVLAVAMSARAERKTRVVYRENTVAATEAKKEFCNILFMGADREASLCDVIMLLNLDYQNGRATVAQIPRDTYAEYTEKSYKKLNGAYNSLGGAEQTAEFLSSSLGIQIDHHICIGLDTMAALVDALGGIDVNLPMDMHYSDPEAGLYIDLKAGYSHLDGEKAEQFLRYRSGYDNGDLGRIDAQKLFMAAFFQTLSEKFSPVTVAKLTAAAKGVETDLSVGELISLTSKVIDMDRESISMLTLPGREERALQSGASYYVLSMPATQKIMNEYFFASEQFDADRLFLNEKYQGFVTAYNTECDCDIRKLGELCGKQAKK